MRILDAGESAILAEFADLDTVLAHFRALDKSRPPGIREVIPAARTIAVRFDCHETRKDRVVKWVRTTQPQRQAHTSERGTGTEEIRIAVRYDGPDLEEVAGYTGLNVDEVIAAHIGTPWTVAFCGFVPGFGYLTGGPPELQVPRRDSPRTGVPAGAVGLAGGFTGIYPRSSPGGWQLIGTTDEPIWEPARTPPALLRPGVVVRFVQE
ncbi:allophanate hydrolase [Rhodococcus sp. WMMA185]|uniref:5-oxoprolinase subunit B family protein n=1 Tax=Rhodococcus sp. WMMA185 TaxID=679318 RepID=UPI00087892C5|nr:allophanate hydrolase subunit 1 [Rhodococcus sp. WMMA185]AOW93578.1 allophanate hydrolase [Rhodococcus sp. WMMA185]